MGGNPQAAFGNMLVVDKFALFFQNAVLSISSAGNSGFNRLRSEFDSFQGEYYALVIVSHFGHDADFGSNRFDFNLCSAGINQYFFLCTGWFLERCEIFGSIVEIHAARGNRIGDITLRHGVRFRVYRKYATRSPFQSPFITCR